MKIFKRISLLISILFSITVQSQEAVRTYLADEGLVPRERQVDYQNLTLNIEFDAEKGKVYGKVKHSFIVLREELDSLRLDGIKMTYNKISLDGKEVKYKADDKGLSIYPEDLIWDSKHNLEIEYEAYPKRGIYFIGWKDTTGRSRKQIWTQGQGIDNRHWIPMYDEKNDKVISEIIVAFDNKYKVLSNGKLLKTKDIGENKKEWQYKIAHPHAPYLIMLGIGEYEIARTKSKSGVPLQFYYYPDQPEQYEPTYKFSVEMFNFFENEIGVKYPWETYAQIPVQDFMYGAMENTTATIFGDFYLIDGRGYLDRNYVRVNAHELAHQWFGDMITARDGASHWLQESFATHYDMMYQKEAFGQDYFDWVRKGYNEQALEASKLDLKPIAHSGAGTVRHYPKGAFVLEMLKYVVGREQFNAAIKYYLEKHAYGSVDSKDLLVAFHERLGYSLDWFWEEWVYKGGEPSYKVEFERQANAASFHVKQTQDLKALTSLFKMPIVFEIHFKDGTTLSKKVMVEEQSQRVDFQIEEDKEIDYYLFDPGYQIMKAVEFDKPTSILKEQAKKAENVLDRHAAIEELISREFDNKDEFLLERYKEANFQAIKAEVLAYFVPKLTAQSIELTKEALKDKDVEVRKAVLANTYRIPEELEPAYRSLLLDSSYVVIEDALRMLFFYYPFHAKEYLKLTEGLNGNRSHNIAIEWNRVAYLSTKQDKYIHQIVDYCSNSYEFLTRVKAAEVLKELNYLDEAALANLLDASFSFNSRLVKPVRNVIDHFYEQEVYKKMIINYVASKDWDEREFRRVNSYLIP